MKSVYMWIILTAMALNDATLEWIIMGWILIGNTAVFLLWNGSTLR